MRSHLLGSLDPAHSINITSLVLSHEKIRATRIARKQPFEARLVKTRFSNTLQILKQIFKDWIKSLLYLILSASLISTKIFFSVIIANTVCYIDYYVIFHLSSICNRCAQFVIRENCTSGIIEDRLWKISPVYVCRYRNQFSLS